VDEIWQYVGARDNNVPADRRGEFGIGSRQNLTMRMQMRRFTRLTNGRIHQTVRGSPAMAAAVDGRLWSFHEIVRLTEEY
jgi:hypothetical protein